MASTAFLQQAYLAYFGRPADPSGLAYYSEKTEAQVKAAFSASPESQAFFGSLEINAQINTIYQNLFNRDAEPAGLAYWSKEIGAGRLSLADAAMGILAGAQNADKTAVANKLAASAAFTAALDTTAEILGYAGAASIAPARAYLHAVDSTAASLTAATAGVDASIAGVVAAGAVSQGQTFTLTAGIDKAADYTGTSGNDTFAGSKSDGTLLFTSLDALDGGAGNDSLTIAVTANIDTASAVGATVKNIESASITSTGTVAANTTAWTGLTSLTTASTGDSTITAATTTSIATTAASPTTGVVVNGGKDVAISITDTATTAAASGNANTVGVTTAAAGPVVVTQTETVTDGAANAGIATGTIRVDGGTTVTVNSLVSTGAANNAADVATIGAIAVNGKGTVTSVSVTQTAATVAYAAAGDKIKVTNGAVTIIDNNTATKSDAITTVTLANYGNSTIQGNALTTLNLTGGSAAATASGTLGISQSASLTTSAPTNLAINMTGGRVGVITDTNDQYKTVDVVSAAAATIAGLDFTNATTLNVSGAGATTISAQTDLAKLTAITSSGGGLSLSGTISNAATFTGGAGKESVDVGATTKAIATGAGDDTITLSASALGTGGSIDAGTGEDTLSMSAANAVTASGNTTFETTISGFERLALAAVAATGTVNLANIDDLNDVAVAGVDAGQALTLSGAQSGINLRFADATQTSTVVQLANNGSADVANVFLTTADNASTLAGLDLTGFETINVASADTDTDTTAASNALTALTAAAAKSIVVTGNAGFALANGFTGTALTNFDAAAVTAGAVTYTSGALAAASTVKGGAGADTLNLAAAVAGTTISAGAGNDAVTGSSTKANTLNGEAGNDTITGGAAADTIDGGAGNDTFVADLTEQAGASTTDGAVINLGATTLAQSAVFTLTGKYLTGAAPSVASGTATYLFSSESTTNDSIVDTLANIENVNGTSGVDYIVGSSGDNVINGLGGNDFLTGGAGADKFVFGASGANGRDAITDFKRSELDTLDVVAATAGTGALVTVSTAAADTTVGLKDKAFLVSTDGTAASVTTNGAATLASADFTAVGLANLATFLAERYSGNSSTTGTDTNVWVINYTAAGSTTTYVYQWDNDTTANAIQGAELALIGVVTRDAALTGTDLVV